MLSNSPRPFAHERDSSNSPTILSTTTSMNSPNWRSGYLSLEDTACTQQRSQSWVSDLTSSFLFHLVSPGFKLLLILATAHNIPFALIATQGIRIQI